jgi:hypothetical protein
MKPILLAIAASLGLAGGLSGCHHHYNCTYKGKTYEEGDTWTDDCSACRCPPEGSKSTYCSPPICDGGAPDGGTD